MVGHGFRILSIVIPDKRYCFDYFSPVTTSGQLLDAYFEKRKRPSPGQVFDHISNAASRKGHIAWQQDDLGGADGLLHDFDQAQGILNKALAKSEYIDVHCWRFTPASFHLAMCDLLNLGLINLAIIAEFYTDGCEFYVALEKQSPNTETNEQKNNRFDLLRKIKDEISLVPQSLDRS